MPYNHQNNCFKRLVVFLLLLLPAVIAFLVLQLTKDAIMTLLALIIYCVAIIPIYNLCIENWDIKYKLMREGVAIVRFRLMIASLIAFASNFLILAILLVLWARYVPFGIESLTMPMPYKTGFWTFVYYGIFVLLWLLWAALENIFFNFFGYIELSEDYSREDYGEENNSVLWMIVVSLCVALLNFAVLSQIMRNFWAVLVISVLAFVMNFLLVKTRVVSGVKVSTAARVGFALAILVWLLYLALTKVPFKRANPNVYQGYNEANMMYKKVGALRTKKRLLMMGGGWD